MPFMKPSLYCASICLATFLSGCGTGVDVWKAVETEDTVALAQFVEKGGDLDTGATWRGKTPLFEAIVQGKKKSYAKLLELGANPNTLCRHHGLTALHQAAAEADPFWLQKGLESGGDPNLVNTHAPKYRRVSLLGHSLHERRFENVKVLVTSGSDINQYCHESLTPLAYACKNCRNEIVRYFVENGADPLIPAPKEQTAIHLLKGRIRTARALPDRKDFELKDLESILSLLKDKGIDIEAASWDGSKWVLPKEPGG